MRKVRRCTFHCSPPKIGDDQFRRARYWNCFVNDFLLTIHTRLQFSWIFLCVLSWVDIAWRSIRDHFESYEWFDLLAYFLKKRFFFIQSCWRRRFLFLNMIQCCLEKWFQFTDWSTNLWKKTNMEKSVNFYMRKQYNYSFNKILSW